MIVKDPHVVNLNQEPGINKFLGIIAWIGFVASLAMLLRAVLGL